MRRFLVAGNWKMHGGLEMTTELISGISREVLNMATISEQRELAYDILVCPPAVLLQHAGALAKSLPISIGAQNVSPHTSGAFTGEVSLPMIAEMGCEYVLIGHSERRELFHETDQDTAEKFAACVNFDKSVVPVLCVGESLSERQQGQTELVVERQLNAVIDAVGIQGLDGAVIAYEPVWAIGTGETASPEQAQAVHAFIRAKLAGLDENIGQRTQILYGGSVKSGNAEQLFSQPDIDGGLIGGASLTVEGFVGICRAAQKLAGHA
ncbi:triose-phosphate isomerase [Arenicella xantha]|uniref:Triosephosphate isomerase n=1 Tax=Arenicella xantha TaxID=644221 RepID=A0A395JL77_9GAMM|nr:triose-phosphate isomerase [Arenicella xantha]RBP51461.1 triosephosphate isomerase [Arenicella xantha]